MPATKKSADGLDPGLAVRKIALADGAAGHVGADGERPFRGPRIGPALTCNVERGAWAGVVIGKG